MINNKLYRIHISSTYDKDLDKFVYKFRKLNCTIDIVSDTSFSRGDIVKIKDIDYINNSIELKVIQSITSVPFNQDADISYNDYKNLPILLPLSNSVPIDPKVTPALVANDDYEIIFTRCEEYNNNKYYCALVAINKIPVTINMYFTDNRSNNSYDASWDIRLYSEE